MSDLNFHQIFRYKIYEQQLEDNESDMEKILAKSKKVTYTLMVLLTTEKEINDTALEQIRDIVTDIKCIAYRPTIFRVVIKNGNYFDLKYDPTPLELLYPGDYKPSDFFNIKILGKKYYLGNNTELESCMDKLDELLSTKPVIKTGGEVAPEEQPTDKVEPPDEKGVEGPKGGKEPKEPETK